VFKLFFFSEKDQEKSCFDFPGAPITAATGVHALCVFTVCIANEYNYFVGERVCTEMETKLVVTKF
jgi:hypothetical protein